MLFMWPPRSPEPGLLTRMFSGIGCRLGRWQQLYGVLLVVAGGAAAAQSLAAPEVAARQHLLIDLSSGRTLTAHDADAAMEPGSAVQLAAALVLQDELAAGRLKRDGDVPVSERARAERRPGAPLLFAQGPTRVDDLLRGLAVLGARDAAVALAEASAGSTEAFVERMNRQAVALGLVQTRFRNVHGDSSGGQTSTPRDIAKLAATLLQAPPDTLAPYAQRQLLHRGVRQDNPNVLLARDGSIDGLLVMHTELAGHGVVATALRDTPAGARRLLVVLSGSSSRDAAAGEAQKLLNWGWQAWDAVRLFAPGEAAATVPVWKGRTGQARLGPPGGLVVTVPRGEGGRLRTTLTRSEPLVAPLTQGQAVGGIAVQGAGGEVLAEVPLVVLEAVPLAGVFGRAWDAIRLWIR